MNAGDMSARDMVDEGFGACLPARVPLPWRAIDRARYVGTGCHRRAVATVTMWDGRKAVVDVGRHFMAGCAGWTFRWLALDGGACWWNGTAWTRLDLDGERALDADATEAPAA